MGQVGKEGGVKEGGKKGEEGKCVMHMYELGEKERRFDAERWKVVQIDLGRWSFAYSTTVLQYVNLPTQAMPNAVLNPCSTLTL